MKQVDFEIKMNELRDKLNAPINELRKLQMELKEEECNIGRTCHEMLARKRKLSQQSHSLGARICEMQQKANEEIRTFRRDNFSTERKLSEVSDWALLNELVSRGFYGTIENDERDAEWMQNFQNKFTKKPTPPQYGNYISIAA